MKNILIILSISAISSFNTQVPPFLIQPSQALQKPIFCSMIRTIFTWCPFASAPFLNCSHKICEFPFFLGELEIISIFFISFSSPDFSIQITLGCMRNGGTCVLKDDKAEILKMFQKADVLVLATPVYFYGISAQMKTFIDRTYPIWQHLGKKEVYYIISAGLGEDIIERSLGDLNGFVEHLEEYKIAGKIYAANVMDAGLVKNQSVFQKAYDMGYSI